jgi:hypothetical protein
MNVNISTPDPNKVSYDTCTCNDRKLAGGNVPSGKHWVPCPVHDEDIDDTDTDTDTD